MKLRNSAWQQLLVLSRTRRIQNDATVKQLKHTIITNMHQIKVQEQIYFITRCIKNNVYTKAINNSVNKLELTHSQKNKTAQRILKNIRRTQHQELSRLFKERK